MSIVTSMELRLVLHVTNDSERVCYLGVSDILIDPDPSTVDNVSVAEHAAHNFLMGLSRPAGEQGSGTIL
jgi:hypothetical protein